MWKFLWAIVLSRSRDSDNRRRAVRILKEVPPRLAVRPLVRLISDTSITGAAYEAVQALGETRRPEAVAPLLKVLKSSYMPIRREALIGLGKLRDDGTVDILKRILIDDDDKQVVYAAACALASIGSPSAITALIDAFESRGSDDARSALGYIVDKRALSTMLSALPRLSDDGKQRLVTSIGNIGHTDAVPALVEVLEYATSGDSQLTVLAIETIEALGKIGDSRAIQPLRKALILGVGDTITLEAAKALSRIHNPDGDEALLEATEALLRQRQALPNPSTFEAEKALALVVETLAGVGGPNSVDPLCRVMELERQKQYAYHQECRLAIAATHSLAKVLERSVQAVPPATLETISRLTNVVQIQVQTDRCGNESGRTAYTADCSVARQLARQELIRRGFSVKV